MLEFIVGAILMALVLGFVYMGIEGTLLNDFESRNKNHWSLFEHACSIAGHIMITLFVLLFCSLLLVLAYVLGNLIIHGIH